MEVGAVAVMIKRTARSGTWFVDIIQHTTCITAWHIIKSFLKIKHSNTYCNKWNDDLTAGVFWTERKIKRDTYTHMHSHNGPCPGLPQWAGTIRSIHPLTSMTGRRRIHTNKVHCLGPHPLYSALSQQVLSDPIKPAYNQSRPDGRLILTASAFNRLWISILAVPTVMQNSLNHLSTFSITAHHLLHFMAQGQIAEANAPTACLDAIPHRLLEPHLHHPPFLCWMLFLPQPSQFILAWDRPRILLVCIPSGMVKRDT